MKVFQQDDIDFQKIKLIDFQGNDDITKSISIGYSIDDLNIVPLVVETIPILYENFKNWEDKIIYLSIEGVNQSSSVKIKNFFKNMDLKIMDLVKNVLQKNKGNKIKYKSLIKFLEENDSKKDILGIKLKKNYKTIIFDKNKKIINKEKYEELFNNKMLIKVILEPKLVLNQNIYLFNLEPKQILIYKIYEDEDLTDNSEIESKNDKNNYSEIYIKEDEEDEDEEDNSSIDQEIDFICRNNNNILEDESENIKYILTDSSESVNN